MAARLFKNWPTICALGIEELCYLLTMVTDPEKVAKWAEILPKCFSSLPTPIKVPVSSLYRLAWEIQLDEIDASAYELRTLWQPLEDQSVKFRRAAQGLMDQAAESIGLTVLMLNFEGVSEVQEVPQRLNRVAYVRSFITGDDQATYRLVSEGASYLQKARRQLHGKIWGHGVTIEHEGKPHVVIFCSGSEIGELIDASGPHDDELVFLIPADELDLNA